MNALKTLHGEAMTRICEHLAGHYHVIRVAYGVEKVEARFDETEGDGWVEIDIHSHYGRGNLQCYLNRYGNRRGGDYKSLLSGGTPEQLYAAINKLIEGKHEPRPPL